jgi:Na+-driven multidrug efflux pump
MVTGLVGLFGADALAGFGTASRLDYVLIPPLFVIGAGRLTVVRFGAGLPELFAIVAAGAVLSAAITAISVSVQLGVRPPAVLSPPAIRKRRARNVRLADAD